ncbi:DUF1269 domain-containing protein [Chloroflexota bacterium]
MKDIPVNAKVECADGPCGQSIEVIVEPTTRAVTHFVVEDTTLRYPPYQRLVPVDQVLETTHDLIRLRSTRDELQNMEPFVETHYKSKKGPDYSMWQGGEYQAPQTTTLSTYTKVEKGRIPEGELGFRSGSRVEATDGYVGHVGEFLAEEGSTQISHLVLREGHLWGDKEITLPHSAVDHIEGDTVYLKLDKQAIERLPAIPFQRSHDADEAHARNIELVARVFDDPEKANAALEFVEDLHRRKVLKIRNAAVLVKDQDGALSVTDTRDLDPKKGGIIGAITGGLIGLVGGPVGVVVGALAGAGVGGLGAKWIDKGFSDKFLTELQEHLQPGRSALIILVETDWAQPLSEAMAGQEGVILQQTLTDELVKDLMGEGEAKA